MVEAALLPALIGSGRARRLLLTGETIGASEALDWGLVDAVAPPERLDAAVERFAAAILAGGPRAIRLQKGADPRLGGHVDERGDRAAASTPSPRPIAPTSRAAWRPRASPRCGRAARCASSADRHDMPRKPRGSAALAGLSDTEPPPPHYYGHRERLRQRLIEAGAETLPDYELLEVLLFANDPRKDVKPLAKALIDRFGGFPGGAERRRPTRCAPPGCASRRSPLLKSVREAALRLSRAELRERPLIGSWDRLIDYCNAQYRVQPGRGIPSAVPRPQERADRA